MFGPQGWHHYSEGWHVDPSLTLRCIPPTLHTNSTMQQDTIAMVVFA